MLSACLSKSILWWPWKGLVNSLEKSISSIMQINRADICMYVCTCRQLSVGRTLFWHQTAKHVEVHQSKRKSKRNFWLKLKLITTHLIKVHLSVATASFQPTHSYIHIFTYACCIYMCLLIVELYDFTHTYISLHTYAIHIKCQKSAPKFVN